MMAGGMAQPPSTVSIQKSPPATIHHVSTYPGTLSSGGGSRETTPTPSNLPGTHIVKYWP